MKKLFSGLLSAALVLSFATMASADTTYEAENANLVGASKAEEVDTASNGAYVLGFDDPAADAVEFTVNVTEAGTYDVEFGYATAMDNASISVNDTVVTTPSTGGWADNGFGTVSASLDLEEGENTVTVKQSTDFVQIDYIKVIGDGAVAEEATDNNEEAAVENPETGDNGIALYGALAVATLAGGALLVARKKQVN